MTMNTLIRLLGCAGLFESLLDAHVRRYIFSHCFSLNPSPAEPGYALPLQTVNPSPAEPGYALSLQTV